MSNPYSLAGHYPAYRSAFKVSGILLVLSGLMTLLFQVNTTGVCYSKASLICAYSIVFWGVAGYGVHRWVALQKAPLVVAIALGLATLLANQVFIRFGVEWSMQAFYGCGDFSAHWLNYLVANNLFTNLLCFTGFVASARLAVGGGPNHAPASPVAATKAPAPPAKASMAAITIKDGPKQTRLLAATIKYIVVEKNCITIYAESGTTVLYESLKSFTQKLDPEVFARAHRSYLVNLHHVARVVNLPSGDGVLETRSGEKLKVSRTYKPRLLAKFRAL